MFYVPAMALVDARKRDRSPEDDAARKRVRLSESDDDERDPCWLPREIWHMIFLRLEKADLSYVRSCDRLFRVLVDGIDKDGALLCRVRVSRIRVSCHYTRSTETISPCGMRRLVYAASSAARFDEMISQIPNRRRWQCYMHKSLLETAVDAGRTDVLERIVRHAHCTSCFNLIMPIAERAGRLDVLEWFFMHRELDFREVRATASYAVSRENIDVLEWYKDVWPEFVHVRGEHLHYLSQVWHVDRACAWLEQNGAAEDRVMDLPFDTSHVESMQACAPVGFIRANIARRRASSRQ